MVHYAGAQLGSPLFMELSHGGRCICCVFYVFNGALLRAVVAARLLPVTVRKQPRSCAPVVDRQFWNVASWIIRFNPRRRRKPSSQLLYSLMEAARLIAAERTTAERFFSYSRSLNRPLFPPIHRFQQRTRTPAIIRATICLLKSLGSNQPYTVSMSSSHRAPITLIFLKLCHSLVRAFDV